MSDFSDFILLEKSDRLRSHREKIIRYIVLIFVFSQVEMLSVSENIGNISLVVGSISARSNIPEYSSHLSSGFSISVWVFDLIVQCFRLEHLHLSSPDSSS